jgi:hypothetical protein
MSGAGTAQRVVLRTLTEARHAGPAMTTAAARGRARLVVLACQDGLAALAARDDQITSSTCARQSSNAPTSSDRTPGIPAPRNF